MYTLRLASLDPDDLHLNPGIDENIMLPCEFCDYLFPDDILIQHQVLVWSDTIFTHLINIKFSRHLLTYVVMCLESVLASTLSYCG